MNILKVETESSFFGLRQRVRFLVSANAVEGEPEDYWMYATEHNIRYMAQALNKTTEEAACLRRQLRKLHQESPRKSLPITMKELAATVSDSVERTLYNHPAIRVLLDKVGGFASGGVVKEPSKPGLVGEHKADAVATSRLEARVTGVEGKQVVSSLSPLTVTLLGEATEPSDIARQIREAAEQGIASRAVPITELVPNTSLEPVQPVEGISANREDRLSPND